MCTLYYLKKMCALFCPLGFARRALHISYAHVSNKIIDDKILILPTISHFVIDVNMPNSSPKTLSRFDIKGKGHMYQFFIYTRSPPNKYIHKYKLKKLK